MKSREFNKKDWQIIQMALNHFNDTYIVSGVEELLYKITTMNNKDYGVIHEY